MPFVTTLAPHPPHRLAHNRSHHLAPHPGCLTVADLSPIQGYKWFIKVDPDVLFFWSEAGNVWAHVCVGWR